MIVVNCFISKYFISNLKHIFLRAKFKDVNTKLSFLIFLEVVGK